MEQFIYDSQTRSFSLKRRIARQEKRKNKWIDRKNNPEAYIDKAGKIGARVGAGVGIVGSVGSLALTGHSIMNKKGGAVDETKTASRKFSKSSNLDAIKLDTNPSSTKTDLHRALGYVPVVGAVAASGTAGAAAGKIIGRDIARKKLKKVDSIIDKKQAKIDKLKAKLDKRKSKSNDRFHKIRFRK